MEDAISSFRLTFQPHHAFPSLHVYILQCMQPLCDMAMPQCHNPPPPNERHSAWGSRHREQPDSPGKCGQTRGGGRTLSRNGRLEGLYQCGVA